MGFLIKAYDAEGMLEKRMEVRPRHLVGMKVLGKQVICAGGLLNEEGRMKESPRLTSRLKTKEQLAVR